MKAKREYRNRDAVQVEVLDALVDRSTEGLTVLELRSAVNADIDAIETALAELKNDRLITVSGTEGSTIIKPDDRVIPSETTGPTSRSLVERIRDWLRL